MGFIYGLFDPFTQELRYIGKTKRSPRERLNGHIYNAQRGKNTHTSFWIRTLLAKGSRPELQLLEECVDTNAEERFWIQYYRYVGCRLTNHTAGGDGCQDPSPETRKKLSDAARRYSSDPEVRLKRSKTATRLFASPEGKMSASKRASARMSTVTNRRLHALSSGGRPFIDSEGEVFVRMADAAQKWGINRQTVMRLLHDKSRKPRFSSFVYVGGEDV
jgi:hypothetical protein